MKKILVGLVITGLVQFSANAQTATINACGKRQDKVCMASKDGKTTSCYKTQYAENFKVCKNVNGYFICCETPGYTNSSYSWFKVTTGEIEESADYNYVPQQGGSVTVDNTVPQSQSYPNTPAGAH